MPTDLPAIMRQVVVTLLRLAGLGFLIAASLSLGDIVQFFATAWRAGEGGVVVSRRWGRPHRRGLAPLQGCDRDRAVHVQRAAHAVDRAATFQDLPAVRLCARSGTG